MVTGRLRTVLQKIHLYLGLSFGLVFVLLGLTGTVIAWRDELDAVLNPELLRASAPAAGPVTPAQAEAVAARLAADPRYGKPRLLMLPDGPSGVFVASYAVKGADGAVPGRSRQVMVDPATLAIQGERIWGQPGLSRPLLMPTLFHLHRYLLAGETGKTITGITGMLMLLTTLGGLLLWLPKLRWGALRQALTIRHGGSWSRFNYSLHRAGGVFVAPIVLVVAFSGWYLNLPKWVTPLVGAVMTVTPPGAKPLSAPAVDGADGAVPLGIGQAMAAALAAFPQARVTRVSPPRKPDDAYEVRLRQPGEVRQGGGSTRVWIDARRGTVLRLRDPLRAPAGDTLLNWLYPLHTGEAFGLPGRILITVFGLAPLAFAVTGLLIWLKRRRGQRRHLARERQRAGVRLA
ncbi:PepSY-associated TM helix domain-containing protein [Cupriavidus malaysiensis]|uniref:PepSY domain-containing protein n=1 Tax=Cupriavidus malaysiensis TaxID=367825 RepID=A0ABM6F715_9BURK|nr:PepSY-associated TM helix domain-containing protein [Cupriavidus malaysiensis]AOZ07373.1 hypothetical protein BKK80_17230 [Cupriavidus malaysiensis]